MLEMKTNTLQIVHTNTRYLLPIFFKIKNLFFFFLCLFFSPTYANDFIVKVKCDVNQSALSSEKGQWKRGKISWELGVNLQKKTLTKKNFFDVGDKTYTLQEKFKVLSHSKNGLVALSEELKSQFTGEPSVATITLDNFIDNLLSDSNGSVGVTYTLHSQSNNEDVFLVEYGQCK